MKRDECKTIETRGERYALAPAGDGRWRVLGLGACSRCDCPGPVHVFRASGTDLNAECCGYQLGVSV